MTQIVLSDDQAESIRGATGPVQLLDRDGKLLGYITQPYSRERIAELKRRAESDGPWHTTAEVLEKLEGLEKGPIESSAEDWCEQLEAWAESHRALPHEANDRRESIYEGRGEQ